jgi:large subunit ribosomal protein L40
MNFRIGSFLSKSILNNFKINERLIHTTSPHAIRLTDKLDAEPLKAKKRLDPQLVKQKEDRRKRKIEKEIKKLEKMGRKLKPIEELRADQSLLKELDQRKRPEVKLSESEIYNNNSLQIEWSRYKEKQHLEQTDQIKSMLKSQEKALNELKKDNFSLYEMAIQIDDKLINFKHEGPCFTPEIKGYEAPEGDYIDVTYLYDRR